MVEVTDGGVPDDAWTAAVWRETGDGGRGSHQIVGTGVVIDERRVLTCAHVARRAEGARLWVRLPKLAEYPGPWLVLDIRFGVAAHDPDAVDVAMLELATEMPTIAAAPVRFPTPFVLQGRKWWTSGFPEHDGYARDGRGVVGGHAGNGVVNLRSDHDAPLASGFSGAGVFCADYHGVVGLVLHADDSTGHGRAVTFHRASAYLAAEKLRLLERFSAPRAGEVAMSSWGWALTTDPEGARHWRPRARGVSVESERGFRFRGRTAVLRVIVDWLDRTVIDRRVLVVTGSPGVGKSAVLGRVVTTADSQLRGEIPANDPAVRATVGSVACAVHAKGKSALEVAVEIAQAANAELPARVDDLPPAIRQALSDRPASRFNVVIDALDEASSPEQARQIVTWIVLPLAQTCADVGVQVIVGSRRRDNAGDLLSPFVGATAVVDLDAPEYFAEDDLTEYSLATLQLIGDERAGSPYGDAATARPVARRIARNAQGNFLIAGLTARNHGLIDTKPVDPETLAFEPSVTAALNSYLQHLPPVGTVPAKTVLTALAYAEPPGLTVPMWRAILQAANASVTNEDLALMIGSSAANFLIESGVDGAHRTYRLFHQALNDALLSAQHDLGLPRADERVFTEALIQYGRATGWVEGSGYLHRSLPAHAGRVGLVDELLTDDQYVLLSDLRRLIPAADHAKTPPGRDRARLLQLTPLAIDADANERSAMFSVTHALEQIPTAGPTGSGPYQARWASAQSRNERMILTGHTDWVNAVCAVIVDGRVLLASASDDHSLRIWDPTTATTVRELTGHTRSVNAVCPVNVDGCTLLASASADGTLRIWDPTTGTSVRELFGHRRSVNAICSVNVDGRTLLASASNDHTVRMWDPVTGRTVRKLTIHTNWVTGVCSIDVGGRALLVSASADGTLRIWDPTIGTSVRTLISRTSWVKGVCSIDVGGRALLVSASNDGILCIWDPATGVSLRELTGHRRSVNGICAVNIDGHTLLASASEDRTLRVWDPATGTRLHELTGHTGSVNGVCSVNVDGHTLLASASEDRTLRMWDPATGITTRGLTGHTRRVNGLCAINIDGRVLLASASNDLTVRIWNPATGTSLRRLTGHTRWVNQVCGIELDGRALLASASTDCTLLVWDPATGIRLHKLIGHTRSVNGVCSIDIDGRTLLASASEDHTLRIWDLATGTSLRELTGHARSVNGVCSIDVAGRTLLASASNDRTLRIWDPASGTSLRRLSGHTDSVTGLCPVNVAGRTLLASASNDRTVRIWDPATGDLGATIPVHHLGLACLQVAGLLIVGLNTGLLALDLSGLP